MREAVWYNDGMESVTVRAYAKINLSLDVTGTRGGYHTIDSVVASVDIFDEITVSARDDGQVTITMRGRGSEDIPPESNNACKAARAFFAARGSGGADISVLKHIPMGAGLGGSSADAAGVLNALCLLFGGEYAAAKAIADSIGSDCGYMLRGGYARLTGRGERVSLIDGCPKLYLIVAFPEGGVSTARCYALSDVYPGHRRTSAAVNRAICAGQLQELGKSLSNGLYPAAAVINGNIRDAVAELSALSPLGVNMTGSGSAVYALFGDETSRDSALKKYIGGCRAVAAETLIPERYL